MNRMYRAILMALPVHHADPAARAWKPELEALSARGYIAREGEGWVIRDPGVQALKAAGSGTWPAAGASVPPPAPVPTVSATSRIPLAVMQAIDARAAAEKTTRSDVICRVLLQEFQVMPAPAPRTSRPPAEPTVRVRVPERLVSDLPGESRSAAVVAALSRALAQA